MLILMVGAYFVPTIVAKALGHSRAGLIFLVNLLAGWTQIGWIAAFAMVWLIKPEEDAPNP
jgi:hypothetical protein